MPITYKKNTVEKGIIKEKDLYKADLDSFDTTIGQITNYSTSFYDLLCKYKDKDDDYSRRCAKEILERLKLTRKAQGDSIDGAKGIKVDPYPSIWIKQQKILEDDDKETQELKKFLNDICADRKPYFFKYRYPTVGTEYEEAFKLRENECYENFGITLEELLESDYNTLTKEQQECVDDYLKYIPLIDYNSPMNKICHYLEQELKDIKSNKKNNKKEQDILQKLLTNDIELSENAIHIIDSAYKSYMKQKREIKAYKKFTGKTIIKQLNTSEKPVLNLEQYAKKIRQEIEIGFVKEIAANEKLKGKSLNETIANSVVKYCYQIEPSSSKAFVWVVLGKYVIENLLHNTTQKTMTTTVPIINKNGNIEYLGNSFEEKEIELEVFVNG